MAADKLFNLEIISATRRLYSGKASSVIVPGESGIFEILVGHAPLMASLITGELIFVDSDGKRESVAVSGGFIEAKYDNVLILSDAAELASQIDIERARQAKLRAEELLDKAILDKDTIDFELAQASLLRAVNRINIVERHI